MITKFFFKSEAILENGVEIQRRSLKFIKSRRCGTTKPHLQLTISLTRLLLIEFNCSFIDIGSGLFTEVCFNATSIQTCFHL